MPGQVLPTARAAVRCLRSLRLRLSPPWARGVLLGLPLAALTSTLAASGQATSWVVPSSVSSGNSAWLDSLVGPDPREPGHPRLSVPDDPVLPVGGDPQVLVLPQAGSTGPGPSAGDASGTGSADTSGLTSSGIPIRVLKSYVAAAQQTARIDPGCHLSWSLLAGIGRVETNHGRFGGARVSADGVVSPAIYGPRLNGAGGFPFIHDTDGGRLDGDPTSDRAVGSMQFLPGTWAGYAVDADGDGVKTPQDVDDASASAGRYLCSGGEDLSTRDGQVRAVLRYNHSMSYASLVLALAASYATGQAQPLPSAPPEGSETSTPTPTPATTPTPKSSPTPTPAPKPSPTPSPTPTPSPKPSPTPTPSPKPSPTPSPTPTPKPTAIPTPTPTTSPNSSPTPTASPTPTPKPTATPAAAPTPTPTPTPSASAKTSPSPTPTPTSTPTPTPTPSGG